MNLGWNGNWQIQSWSVQFFQTASRGAAVNLEAKIKIKNKKGEHTSETQIREGNRLEHRGTWIFLLPLVYPSFLLASLLPAPSRLDNARMLSSYQRKWLMYKCNKQAGCLWIQAWNSILGHTDPETSSSPAAQAKGSHSHGAVASPLMYHPAWFRKAEVDTVRRNERYAD